VNRQAKVYMPEVVQIIERELARYTPTELADMVLVNVPVTPVPAPALCAKTHSGLGQGQTWA
jgi:hypothetical protein